MMTAYDIVIRPIITERAMAGAADKKYVFEVAKSAGKVEIKKAAPCLRTFLFFAKICVNLRFNTYLLKYQLIHNRVGMN